MSVIFGLFYKDGRQIDGELHDMYSGMKHFPHEKHAFAIKNDCGLGHMLTYNTPEAVGEAMPKWIESAQILFVAEGRLDNRTELFDGLNIKFAERVDMPDGELMLRAYLKWKEDCVDFLLGKWSLAVYHTDERRLFIARDKWDYTDVEYYEDDTVFAFSTSEKGLFPLPFIHKKIDEIMVARLLVVWPGDYDKSFYKGIRLLMPSHEISVTKEKTQLRRYWNYEDICVIEGRRLEDYTEALFDALNKAVKARLRSYKPVAATLSGGLDSSTVCVLAAEQLAAKQERLKTYTHVPQFEPSETLPVNKFGDERPFVEAFVKATSNIDPVFLNSAGISPIEGIRQAISLYGRPFHGASNAYWMMDIFLSAARDNYGTLLMGEFGNATISWTGNVDGLSVGEILQRYGILSLIKKKLLKPMLYGDTLIADTYKRVKFGKRPWAEMSYCTEAFEESLHLAERIRKSDFDPTHKNYFTDPKRQVMRILNLNVSRLSYGTIIGCETGLELRDPTGDSRVIECALAIPNEMFLGEMNKHVLRTMMKEKLPDVIRLNKERGKQSADITTRLYAHRDEMDQIIDEMMTSDFCRIANMQKIQEEWDQLKADCASFKVNKAAQILRPVAAYELYRMTLKSI